MTKENSISIKKKAFKKKDSRKRCFNCGEFHETTDCPSKEKGPKCFICNQWGHKSSTCSAKKPETSGVMKIMRTPIKRPTTQIKINDQIIEAHIDSQSDFTVVRENIIKRKQIPVNSKKCFNQVKGVGGCALLKAQFAGKIGINNDVLNVNCYTMAKNDLDVEMIIGQDVIIDCSLIISPEETILRK